MKMHETHVAKTLLFRLSYFPMDFFEMFDAYQSKIENSSAKMAFFVPEEFLNQIESKKSTSGIRLKTILRFHPSSMVSTRNSLTFPIEHEMNEKLSSAGIIQYEFVGYRKRYKFIPDAKSPKVLSIADLDFGFVVWLIACGISFFAFLSEIFVKLLLVNGIILLQNIIGIYYFAKLLKDRLRMI